MVFKCLNGTVPTVLRNCFPRMSHSKGTRGNKRDLILPKVKTECGRKSFGFQGALVFDKLPDDLKTEQSLLIFKYKSNDVSLDY